MESQPIRRLRIYPGVQAIQTHSLFPYRISRNRCATSQMLKTSAAARSQEVKQSDRGRYANQTSINAGALVQEAFGRPPGWFAKVNVHAPGDWFRSSYAQEAREVFFAGNAFCTRFESRNIHASHHTKAKWQMHIPQVVAYQQSNKGPCTRMEVTDRPPEKRTFMNDNHAAHCC